MRVVVPLREREVWDGRGDRRVGRQEGDVEKFQKGARYGADDGCGKHACECLGWI